MFEHLRDIRDPEHPHTLEELNVMQMSNIHVDDEKGHVRLGPMHRQPGKGRLVEGKGWQKEVKRTPVPVLKAQ